MKKMTRYCLWLFFAAFLLLPACRKEETPLPPVVTPVDSPAVVNPIDSTGPAYSGFYLLNEGNMGSNKASLDFYDYRTGNYNKNIYASVNPDVVKELGDVGNDIQVYGSKLYVVVNVSNKVEVLEAATAKRIGQINILNCRYITFHNGKAYISSYAGPVLISPDAPIGFVAEVDTTTLQITRKVIVGYQPEEMAVVGNKLYVANSGGYRVPDYDSTVSVIDLASFQEIQKIDVGINLHRLKADRQGDLYVSSRGDYYTTPSRLFLVDTKTATVKKQFDLAVSNMAIAGDTAYITGSEFSYTTHKWEISYSRLDLVNEQIIPGNFITDGTETAIKMPYGVAVSPLNGDIYVTDARDYVSPGTLYCFSPEGKKKWSVTTGDIPAHFAFLPR